LILIGPYAYPEFLSLYRVVNGYDYWKDTSKGAKYFSFSLPSLKQLKEDFKSDGPYLGFYYKNGVIPLEIAEDSMYRTVYDHELEYDYLSHSPSFTCPPTTNYNSVLYFLDIESRTNSMDAFR